MLLRVMVKKTIMNIKPVSTISFGYKNPLKTHWLKGDMPSVKYGIYGGELTKKNVSLEHIVPHSKCGKTVLSNSAFDVNNRNRSGDFFSKYYDKNTFEKYCNQFVGVKFSDLNGLEYVDNFKKNSR